MEENKLQDTNIDSDIDVNEFRKGYKLYNFREILYIILNKLFNYL